MHWTLQRIAQALAVEPPAEMALRAEAAGVSIDSRTIARRELFFAIRGPHHDGHAFVEAVLAAGAVAAVIDKSRLVEFPRALHARLLGVPDTSASLSRLASEMRFSWGESGDRKMAAVTGSSGKTTTKEILADLLASRFPVLRSHGNLNNAYGLPLTLCRLESRHRAAVVELGMSRRGELRDLAAIALPEVGLVTNVSPAHLEFFASVDEIALAKRELIEGLAGPDPVAVLNADDARVSRFGEGFPGRVITYGRGAGADYRAEAIEDRGVEGTAFDCSAKGQQIRIELPLVGVHNVMNALAALAAAGLWGISLAESRAVLARLEPTGHRGRILRFRQGFVLVDDSYNSNPAALASMIDWLAAAGPVERRILATGEMLELGPASHSLHHEAGRWAAGRVDWIFGVQGEAAEIVRGAVEAGHPADRARFFATAAEAAEFLDGWLRGGDLAVVKGSRGVRMDQIVEAVTSRHALAEPETAGKRERR